MKIDHQELNQLRHELEELAGSAEVRLKVRNDRPRSVSVTQTDRGYIITINAHAIHSRNAWEQHKNWLRKVVNGV